VPKDGVKLKGFDELEKAMKKLPGRIARKELANATRAGGSVIRKEARIRLKPHRSTGRLSRGIIMRTAKRASTWVLVKLSPNKDVYWGRFLEFGTKHQGAKPWLTPALDSKKDEAVKAIGKRLWVGIKRQAAKLAR